MSARRTPIATWPLVLAIRAYQVTLRPFMGAQCRYHPTCSQYGLDALREHGAIRGGWLTCRRLLRCHPLAKGGYDPVPPREPNAQTSRPRTRR
ncbi:MAG: membrane protein insertion efficiency factor YidD [Phycisphaerales bacterium]|nr:MAG: membrane protein insertion efficiency factor YidD [Phycisphaerales bacterium]